jgi:hypothetical protein
MLFWLIRVDPSGYIPENSIASGILLKIIKLARILVRFNHFMLLSLQ